MTIVRNTLVLIIIMMLSVTDNYSQCSQCTTLKRDDGTTIRQCPTQPVAADQSIQIGLSATTNGVEYFVVASVRFRYGAQKILSPLVIHLENNQMVNLSLVSQQEVSAGGSDFVQGFYSATKEQLAILKSASIKIVHIKLTDGKLRPIEASKNSSVLKDGFKCLN